MNELKIATSLHPQLTHTLHSLATPTTPHKNTKARSSTPSLTTRTHLRICSFNCRSVYGREKDLIDTMQTHSLSFLALQEPKLFANAPPQGLDPALYYQHSLPGIRGFINKPSRHWTNSLSLPNVPHTDSHLWTTLHTPIGLLHIAICYFSPNTDENKITLSQLSTLGQHLLRGPSLLLLGRW